MNKLMSNVRMTARRDRNTWRRSLDKKVNRVLEQLNVKAIGLGQRTKR